jgi:hypothetical protein
MESDPMENRGVTRAFAEFLSLEPVESFARVHI